MGCKYTFEGEVLGRKFSEVQQDSVEALLEMLLQDSAERSYSFREQFFTKEFLFYDAGVTAQDAIDAAIRAYKENKKIISSDNTVTKQSADISFSSGGEYGGRAYLSSSQKQLIDWVNEFRQHVGTAIHEIIAMKLRGEDTKKGIEKLRKKILEDINKLSPEMQSSATTQALNNIEYETYVTALQLASWCKNLSDPKNRDLFDRYVVGIQNAADQINSRYKGCKLLLIDDSTKPLAQRKSTDNAKLMYGQPDLVVEKPDGTIVIVDFKTALTLNIDGSTKMSEATIQYHYAQLQAYKRILASHGFDPHKIVGENLIIKFNRGGIACDLINDEANYVINPERSQIDGRMARNVNAMLNRYFPSEQIPQIESSVMKAIEEKQSALCEGMMLKKWETESLTNSIIVAAKNQNYRYMFSISKGSKTCKLKIIQNDEKDPIVAGYQDGENGQTEVFRKKVSELVKDEQNSIKEKTENDAEVIYDIIQTRDVERLKQYIQSPSRGKQRRGFWSNLYKYCSENYSIVESPELLKQGIIVVKHQTRGFELIVLSSESSNLEFSNNPNESVLLSVIGKDNKTFQKYKESKEILRASIGNMYAMRAYLALSELADKVPTFKENKLIGINVVSVNSGASTGLISSDQLRKTVLVLQQVCKEDKSLEKRDKFLDVYDKIKDIQGYSTTEQWELMLVDSLKVAASEYLNSGLEWDPTRYKNIDEKLGALDALIKMMEEDPILQKELQAIGSKKTDRGKVNNDNQSSIVKVYQLAKTIRAKLRDNVFIENKMNNYSINFQESILNGINLLTKGSVQQYTKNGLMLTGLAQGLAASNAYASPSKLIQRFQHFYDAATGRMLSQLQNELIELNDATEEFIAAKKRSSLIDKIVGNHNEYYKGLFQLGEDGKVKKDMLFQNPYENNKLTSEEAKYLKIVLWTLNRHRMVSIGKTKELDLQYKSMSYEQFSKTDGFQKYVENLSKDSRYLEIPLKMREGSSGFTSGLSQVLTSDKKIKDFAKDEIARCRAMIDRELLDGSQQSLKDQAIEQGRYINYFEENEEMRATRVESRSPEEWEWNVNSLCVEYALADLKAVYFNDLLKVADDQFAAIAIIEDMTGQDLSNQTEELFNRMQISIYNKNNIPEEWQDVVGALGVAKSAMALTKIAVRPALLMKEMLLGRIRNTAAILADQIHQDEGREIKLSHLTDAAMEVFGANFLKEKTYKIFGKYPAGHKSIADKLNDTYSINDRDLSVIGDKFSYDSYGLHNFAARMLYVNTIAPDWFNRMIIFIAKMKADGCWKAHTLDEETGQLIYDIEKDERVNYYWIHRKENLVNDERYVRQKAYFIEKMRQFEQDGWKNPDGSKLVYGSQEFNPSPFPRAYTTTEEESAKEQIGLIYGYYSHQERASYQKGLWYNLQTAFLTFLPAEVRKAFATGRDSSIYVTRQKKDIDGKPLYWEKSQDGELTKETTNKIDGDSGTYLEPVMETVPDPYTGTVISTCKVINLLCKRDYDALKRDPRLVKQMEILLFNTLFAMFVAAIMAALANSGVKTVGSQIVGDTIKRAANELDFYHAVIEPVGNFGLVGVDYLNNTFSSAFNAITSENYSLLDFANENFAIVKDLHLNTLQEA